MYSPAMRDSAQASSRDGPSGSSTSRADRTRRIALGPAAQAAVGDAESLRSASPSRSGAPWARHSSIDSSRASAAGAHWSRVASSRPELSSRSARTSGCVGADEPQRTAVLRHGLAPGRQRGRPVAGAAWRSARSAVRRARPRRGGPGGRRRRLRSGSSSARMRRCISAAGVRADLLLDARRAISWRKRSTAPSATSRPAATGSSRAAGSAPVTACEQGRLDALADQGRGVEHLASGRATAGRRGRARRRARTRAAPRPRRAAPR